MTDVYFRDAHGKTVVLSDLTLVEVAAESYVYRAGDIYFETKPDPTIKELLAALREAYNAESGI